MTGVDGPETVTLPFTEIALEGRNDHVRQSGGVRI
jgi:hypothetical protein